VISNANRFKAIAGELLQRYQQPKVRGELRGDDKLYLELTQMLPAISNIWNTFEKSSLWLRICRG
jgi:hypothetical protein